MIRLIIIRNDETYKEEVLFTEDRVTPGAQWCADGDYVVYDKEINVDLPSTFPTEYSLRVVK